MAAGGAPNRRSLAPPQLLLNALEVPMRVWRTTHNLQVRIMEALSTLNLHRVPSDDVTTRSWLDDCVIGLRYLDIHIVKVILITQQSHPSLAVSFASSLGDNNCFIMQAIGEPSSPEISFRIPQLSSAIHRFLNEIEAGLEIIERELKKPIWTVSARSRVQRAPVFQPPVLEHIIGILFAPNVSGTPTQLTKSALEFLADRRKTLREKIGQYQVVLESNDRHSATDSRDLRHEVDKLEDDLQLVHNLNRMMTNIREIEREMSRVELGSGFAETPERQRDGLNDTMDEGFSNLENVQTQTENVRKLKDEISHIQDIVCNNKESRRPPSLVGLYDRTSESEERKTWEDFERNTHEMPRLAGRGSNRNETSGGSAFNATATLRRESLPHEPIITIPLVSLSNNNKNNYPGRNNYTPASSSAASGFSNIFRGTRLSSDPSLRTQRYRDTDREPESPSLYSRCLMEESTSGESSLPPHQGIRRRQGWSVPHPAPPPPPPTASSSRGFLNDISRLSSRNERRNNEGSWRVEGSSPCPRHPQPLLLSNDLGSNNRQHCPLQDSFGGLGAITDEERWSRLSYGDHRANIAIDLSNRSSDMVEPLESLTPRGGVVDDNYQQGIYLLGQRLDRGGRTSSFVERDVPSRPSMENTLSAQISDNTRELIRSMEQLLLVVRRSEQVLIQQRNYITHLNDGLNELRQDVSEIRDDVMLMRYVATISHNNNNRRESMSEETTTSHVNRNMAAEDSYRNIEVPEGSARPRRGDNLTEGPHNNSMYNILPPWPDIHPHTPQHQHLEGDIEAEMNRAVSRSLSRVSRDESRDNPNNLMLNNQVPPGNRANNYWDNFKSYSRQNMLSNSKVNIPLGGPLSDGGPEDRLCPPTQTTNEEVSNSAPSTSSLRADSSRSHGGASMKSFSANFVENIGMKKRNKDHQKVQPPHPPTTSELRREIIGASPSGGGAIAISGGGGGPPTSTSSNSSPSHNELQFTNSAFAGSGERVGLVDVSRELKSKSAELPALSRSDFGFNGRGTPADRISNRETSGGGAGSPTSTSLLLDVDLMPVDLLFERQRSINSPTKTPQGEQMEKPVETRNGIHTLSNGTTREEDLLPQMRFVGSGDTETRESVTTARTINGESTSSIFRFSPLEGNGVVSSPDLVFGIEGGVNGGRAEEEQRPGNRETLNANAIDWCRTSDEMVSRIIQSATKSDASVTSPSSHNQSSSSGSKKNEKKKTHSGGGDASSSISDDK